MIDDTTKEIVYRDYVDISVAVATPRVGTARPQVWNWSHIWSSELHYNRNLLIRLIF